MLQNIFKKILFLQFVGDGRVLHKLHYHERNVVSLAWCPVPYNPLISDHSTQPLLLASTACDRTGLYICRAGLDMFGEVTVSLPTKPLRKTIYKYKKCYVILFIFLEIFYLSINGYH